MGILNNKRRGHAAEIEIAKRVNSWGHAHWFMERTGLDGGHDLRGTKCIAEVKTVKTGPAWLKGGLAQLDTDDESKEKLLFVKLSRGPGRPSRWLIIMDVEQWEEYI